MLLAPLARAEAPTHLRDTGLYSNWETLTVDPTLIDYAPAYPLWTDGAEKHRWLYLPPGTSIDASDPDHWDFPVGTKLWKEFAWAGHRVETRFIERTEDGWTFGAYSWSEDQRDAVLAPERGIPNVYEIEPGVAHTIPGVFDCKGCHEGRGGRVIGFSLLQLSSRLKALVQEGRITGLPTRFITSPPRIHTGSNTGDAAVGYLHGNCGHCHNSEGPLAFLGLDLWHGAKAEQTRKEPAVQTALEKTGTFTVPGEAGSRWRLHAVAPEQSALLYRMRSRNPMTQMPPLGTRLVDEHATGLVQAWLDEQNPQHPLQKGSRP